MRDQAVLATRGQQDGRLRLPFPTREQIATAALSVHNGGQPVICVGAMPTLQTGYDDVELIEQQGETQEWLLVKKEVDIMAQFRQ